MYCSPFQYPGGRTALLSTIAKSKHHYKLTTYTKREKESGRPTLTFWAGRGSSSIAVLLEAAVVASLLAATLKTKESHFFNARST